MSTIHAACRDGAIEVVRELVDADPSLVDADDEHRWRPIFHAALYRRSEVVQFLIEAGADLAAHDGYVLHYASEVPDNMEVVRQLVAHGALDAHVRPTDDLSRQLLAALFLNNVARVDALLRLHPELATRVDGRGDHPIHHAARNGSVSLAKLLLGAGADVNVIGANGHTVLYCAAGHGHVETVRLLLDRGADTQVPFTPDGKTVLDWLRQYPDDARFANIISLLAERGDIDTND